MAHPLTGIETDDLERVFSQVNRSEPPAVRCDLLFTTGSLNCIVNRELPGGSIVCWTNGFAAAAVAAPEVRAVCLRRPNSSRSPRLLNHLSLQAGAVGLGAPAGEGYKKRT